MKSSLILLPFLLSCYSSYGATLVVDSFAEGDFSLVFDDNTSAVSAVSSALGTTRAVSINSRSVATGSSLSSTLDSSAGSVFFSVDGGSTGTSPLRLRTSYSGSGPHSLLGYDAFEFDFTSLEGTGFLVVELGSPSAVYGPEANRVAIDTAGVVTLPFSQLNFANNGTLGSFDVITFTFEAESQEFSMTVNEIRAVPEPSVLALATSFLVTILLRRRRN